MPSNNTQSSFESARLSVCRSTDSELKLWDLNKGIVRTYKGHVNEKNFVGLSVTPHFIACGEYHVFKGNHTLGNMLRATL